jgi:hypothetical protein
MSDAIKLISWVSVYGAEILSAVVSAITALIALFMLIPGEQPEKALQKLVDFIAKFSRK